MHHPTNPRRNRPLPNPLQFDSQRVKFYPATLMTTPSQASSPSIYSDPTLRIAVLCVVAIAVVQAIAALIALAPALRINDFTQARELPATLVPPASAYPENPADAFSGEASLPIAAPIETIERANQVLEEADTLRAQGDLQSAFEALTEADRLVPQEPGILYQMAVVAFEMGRLTQSRELASRAISMPSLRSDPNYAGVYQQLTLLLSELGAPAQGLSSTGEPLPGMSAPSSPAPGAPAPAKTETPGASRESSLLRDDAGIPIGSVFGIVEARLTDADADKKILRVATKASPTEKVDAADFKVVVYFYEQVDDGSILETDSTLMSEWMSPPINWSDGDPELLELRYPMPPADLGDRQYFGYVIGIYFKGELQDSRAEPVSLLEQFPLELTSSQPEE